MVFNRGWRERFAVQARWFVGLPNKVARTGPLGFDFDRSSLCFCCYTPDAPLHCVDFGLRGMRPPWDKNMPRTQNYGQARPRLFRERAFA